MNLIQKPIVRRIDNRPSVQEFSEQCRPTRSVNSAEANNDAALHENQILGLPQNFSGFMLWFGRTLLGHYLAVRLRVHAGTAREQKFRAAKPVNKISRAVEINAPVKIDIAAASTRTMNYDVEVSFTRSDIFFIGNVDAVCTNAALREFLSRLRRQCPPFDFPMFGRQQIRQRLSQITASGDEGARHDVNLTRRPRRSRSRRTFVADARGLDSNELAPAA